MKFFKKKKKIREFNPQMEIRDFWVELKLGQIDVSCKGIRTDKILIRKEIMLTSATDLMENWLAQMNEMRGQLSRIMLEVEQEVKHLRKHGVKRIITED